MQMIKRSYRATVLMLGAAALLAAGTAVAQTDTGNADFTNYVSLGDSLTAGFMSGGLVEDVQAHSYPLHIFVQATSRPASAFEQPTVSAPGIPALLQLNSLAPLIVAPAGGIGSPTNLTLPRPYSNMAVPGAEVDDVLNTVTDGGGLHDLILRGLGTQLQQAVALGPTFATVWIGNNDALAAATSGVVIEGVTLTSAANFEQKYRAIVGVLAGAGVQMALGNISDVTAIPFVTTIAPIVVNPATSQPVLIGGNVIPLIGPDGPLVPGRDFVLLSATAELAGGRGIPVALGGSGQPLSNQSVLSGAEATAINARIGQFNSVIRAVANETGSALVNFNSIFNNIAANGLGLGGIGFSTSFLTGGLFSFDGVHPTPLGYAISANSFIRAINTTFGANIPPVGLGPYVFGPFASAGTGLNPSIVASLNFTRRSEEHLRFGLGVPSRKAINDILRGTGGSDSGGDSGGAGGNNGGGADGDDNTSDPGCAYPRGHGKYCDYCGPCDAGEGDCDLNKPNQCAAGLTCVQDVGATYGFHPNIDVCR